MSTIRTEMDSNHDETYSLWLALNQIQHWNGLDGLEPASALAKSMTEWTI
jgi:hypothetical protein